jgi:hypothetical protein
VTAKEYDRFTDNFERHEQVAKIGKRKNQRCTVYQITLSGIFSGNVNCLLLRALVQILGGRLDGSDSAYELPYFLFEEFMVLIILQTLITTACQHISKTID